MADDDDDFSTFGMPASGDVAAKLPDLDEGLDDEFDFAGVPATGVALTTNLSADDDDEFAEVRALFIPRGAPRLAPRVPTRARVPHCSLPCRPPTPR